MREPAPPVTAADLGIEVVTQYRPAADPYTSAYPKVLGGGARLVAISLAKVRWLDRPFEDEGDPDRSTAG